MHTLTNKIKLVISGWFIFSVVGGLLVSINISPNIAAIISLLGFTVTYYLGSTWFNKPILNKDQSTEKTESEANDFISNVEDIKNRLVQLYSFDDLIGKTELSKLEIKIAYRKALLRTIVNDKFEESNRTITFSKYFSQQLETKKIYNISFYKDIDDINFDKVIFEISNKTQKTKFQHEYLSFVTWVIHNNYKNLEELSFGYTMEDGQLSIKRIFNNWFGYKVLSILKLIDSNIEHMGTHELLNFQFPVSNNKIDKK